jgi:RNA polymerase sigma-70 factor (ECF subfamily)
MRSLFLIPAWRLTAGPIMSPITVVFSATLPGGAAEQTEPLAPSAGDDQPNPGDLGELMSEHSDAVFRLALSVVRDRALAEDVTQETMLKAWLALPTFRGDASLRSWVMRIAHNTAISTLRSRRFVVSDPNEMPEAPAVVERSTERRVEGAHVVDAFVGALDLLDDLSRSIVVLRELEGMSYDEIGRILDVPLPTVKTRLLRARRLLGNALREWK